MNAPRRPRSWSRTLLEVLGWERGAVLWVPSLLAAAYLVLFGIRQAPLGFSLFHYSTGLRIVLGPMHPGSATDSDRAGFVAGLRRGLGRRGSIDLVEFGAHVFENAAV